MIISLNTSTEVTTIATPLNLATPSTQTTSPYSSFHAMLIWPSSTWRRGQTKVVPSSLQPLGASLSLIMHHKGEPSKMVDVGVVVMEVIWWLGGLCGNQGGYVVVMEVMWWLGELCGGYEELCGDYEKLCSGHSTSDRHRSLECTVVRCWATSMKTKWGMFLCNWWKGLNNQATSSTFRWV